MTQVLITNYSFNASAKILDLSSIASFDIKKLYKVTNVTTQTVIYDPNNKLGYIEDGTNLTTGVIKLEYNTTNAGMLNTDELQIIYDATATTNVTVTGSLPLPTGASTESTALSILQAIQNVKAYQETILSDDNSGVLTWFFRRVVNDANGNAVVTNLRADTGAVYTPTGIVGLPMSSASKALRSILYLANTGGTGYSAGDYVMKTDIFDLSQNPAIILSTIWDNISTNTVISTTPTNSNLDIVDKKEAQESTLQSTNIKLDTLHSDLNTTLHNDISNSNTKLDILHTDLNTTLHGDLNTLNAKDFATQTTLALAKTDLDNIYTKEMIQSQTGTLTGTGSVTLSNLIGKTSAAIRLGLTSMSAAASFLEVSYDNGTTWDAVSVTVASGFLAGATYSGSSGINISNGGFGSSVILIANIYGANAIRFRCNTFSGTSLSVNINASADNPLSQIANINSTGSGQNPNIFVTQAANQSVNLAQVGATTISPQTEPTSAQAVVPVMLMGDTGYNFTSGTDVKTNSGTLDLSSLSKGANFEAGLYLSALSGGSSPTIDFKLQTLRLNGTTDYQDVWHCERLSAINNYVYIPPMTLSGVKRLTWTVTGSPTIATLTINSRANSGNNPIKRQFFDRTASILAGTTGAGTVYNISGCKIVNANILASAVTVGATYQLEVSSDGINFLKVGTKRQLLNANELLVLDGLTNNTYNFARINCVDAFVTSQTGVYGLITGTN